MAEMNCIVVTPERTVLETKADFIALPLFDGEIGIAPLHSPMIGRLGFGEMRINQGSTVTTWYVDGGFVQVADDVVTVLTNLARSADKIDMEAARSQIDAAMKRPINTPELLEIRDRLVDQARAQMAVGRRH
ncbi:ATP synthase F1 subunit epsilon [Lignipirellula cremea]|uniref:ATP synthase epsilon chain n=1 Tax=Lignipirellula cremea TaxID=2528010 RepID=A0A518E379_9BACT|nr:ATP synthase F1 subunit epsilon [Lignipirellula cremea]QDU98545.1 ATP synthase epsilon chain, sodium ion specific [Lignipirellula cremea]